jgi:tRNA modification GTPase
MIYTRLANTDGIIDEALVCYMKAPRSYTGEDVFEIQCHGGYASARAILSSLLSNGARAAAPGEFTKRAFLNGRIDLVQAESVMEIVSAESADHLRHAERLMDGTFSRRIEKILADLTLCLSLLELNIDFLHQGGIDAITRDELKQSINAIISTIDTMLSTYTTGKRIREGIKIVLAGNVNTGKSSLFNAILGRRRAIVNSTPGTTRDWIEEKIELGGVAVNLIDTAGLRLTEDDIEREGVTEAERLLGEADVVLYLIEGTETPIEQHKLEKSSARIIRVLSKSDLHDYLVTDNDSVAISSKTGDGISQLIDIMTAYARSTVGMEKIDNIVLIERHRSELLAAHTSLDRALDSIEHWSEEVTVFELNETKSHIEAILGRNIDIDVLDSIFSSFCIGK